MLFGYNSHLQRPQCSVSTSQQSNCSCNQMADWRTSQEVQTVSPSGAGTHACTVHPWPQVCLWLLKLHCIKHSQLDDVCSHLQQCANQAPLHSSASEEDTLGYFENVPCLVLYRWPSSRPNTRCMNFALIHASAVLMSATTPMWQHQVAKRLCTLLLKAIQSLSKPCDSHRQAKNISTGKCHKPTILWQFQLL